MPITSDRMGDVTVVEVQLETVDAHNAASFRGAVEPHLTSRAQIVMDFHKVDFIDSRGLGVLLSFLKTLDPIDGTLVICGLRDDAKRTFELVRLDRIIRVFATREEALGFYRDAGLSG